MEYLIYAKQFSYYFIIVITNQSGISRELYTEKDFHIVTEYMLKEFKKKQIKISKSILLPIS